MAKIKNNITDLVIFYKINGYGAYASGGLGFSASNTKAVLEELELGLRIDIQGVASFQEVIKYCTQKYVKVCLIEAIWVTPADLTKLQAASLNRNIKIVVRAHSKMGFLQVEPEAITKMRGISLLSHQNIFLASNNEDFADAWMNIYGSIIYLPNLFDVSAIEPKDFKPVKAGQTIKIGSFGATRLLKLHPTAAMAALQLARTLNCNLEFYVNVDSTPGGDSVLNTIRNMFMGLPWAKLVEVPWQDPTTFQTTIGQMDLVLQLSATETFNMVCAQAVAAGVPVVSGGAIGWVRYANVIPVFNADSIEEVAAAGMVAVESAVVSESQLGCLVDYLNEAVLEWRLLLGVAPAVKKPWWRFGF